MHRHVYLTEAEQEALQLIADEIGLDDPRAALKFALAAVIDTFTDYHRKESDGTPGNPS